MITGGANGIGKAHATILAKEHGFNLVLVDIDEQGLKQTKEELSGSASVHTITADLSGVDPKLTEKLWTDVLKTVPDRNISIVLNNLGITNFGSYHDKPSNEIQRESFTNTFPNIYLSKHALEHFKERHAEGK
jgi:short-subunit dehydrogenase